MIMDEKKADREGRRAVNIVKPQNCSRCIQLTCHSTKGVLRDFSLSQWNKVQKSAISQCQTIWYMLCPL